MSNQQEGDYANPGPLSKRQKRGDGNEKAFGGPMYDEATAHKMLKEAVLLAAEDTEAGEAVIGFDPDDAALENSYDYFDNFLVRKVNPMIYFAEKEDVKMCRYLASRGASTTKVVAGRNPMYVAALEGHLEVCKFLHANGASHDIRKETFAWTPFHAAVYKGHDEVVRWLVLQGALCANDSSENLAEGVRIYPKNYVTRWNRISYECERLVGWAEEVTQSHSALVMFLLGTLPPPPGKEQSCILQCFSGHPGVLKHIGDFVGLEVTKGKHLRILRNVVDVLPSFIED